MLPDLFQFDDGSRVKTPADWSRRRQELLRHLLAIEYGELPATGPIAVEELNRHAVGRWYGVCHTQYHVRVSGKQWVLDLLVPDAAAPRPVVLYGDQCWKYLTDEITLEILRRGYIVAAFNRTEIVPDQAAPGRTGALAAWAWGYHRCVDVLVGLPQVDAGKIAICGHSRGGKTVLLAAATDERIALAADNASGCGGCAPFRSPPPQAETLAQITERFPHWFSPRLREFAGREQELPFDQHALAACIAPRGLLTTLALGDLWANPTGAWEVFVAAREVWRWLGAAQRIGISYRPGQHEHSRRDWETFLDFADWQLRGRPLTRPYDEKPADW